jgi:hypothetical protein
MQFHRRVTARKNVANRRGFDHLNSTVNFGRGAEKISNHDNATLDLILHLLENFEANIHAKSAIENSSNFFVSANSTPNQAT